jgi:carbon-monoxide dehydrogenase large subunit
MAQLAADALGIKFENVRVVQGDTAASAYATGSWGSRTAVIASGALLLAAGDVKAKLLAVAAGLLEASADDLEIYDGVVSVKGAPFRSKTIEEVALMAYWGPRPEGVDPIPAATRSYDPPQTYSNACIAAVVEVDAQTGQVEVQRLVVVEDCGTVLNPMIVDGQVAGAVAQGVGAVLYEGLPYSEEGQFQAATLADFLYPTTTEVPAIEIHHLETPSPLTAGGFKGMGEGGLIGAPAAIVNAVADALAPFGASIEKTPLRPEDVLDLIDGSAEG